MSLIKFELKKEHIALLKSLRFSATETQFITNETEEGISPFGGDDVYEDMTHIIYGKPEDFDPFNGIHIEDSTVEEFKVLLSELPTALEIVLSLQTFDIGHYKRKFHDRFGWKRNDKMEKLNA